MDANKILPTKDIPTATATSASVSDNGDGDGVLVLVERTGDVEDKGSKEVVQIYSPLLLISSNNTSFSNPRV